jgi:ABC-2 type transport system ATP-binding protein
VLEIRAMLRALGGSQTLIFSSHILAEVEALCDRVVILAGGKCVADEAVAEALRGSDVIAAWIASLADVEAVLTGALRSLSEGTDELAALADALGLKLGAWETRGDAAQLRITCPDAQVAETLVRAIGRASAAAGVPLVRLELGRGRLEERFARVTGAVAEA